MKIAIDGPVASGKSTLARALADRLGVLFVSTGLLYRALAYLLVQHAGYTIQTVGNPRAEDIERFVKESLEQYSYTAKEGAVIPFHGQNIVPFLKTPQVDRLASLVAVNKEVRAAIVACVYRIVKDKHVVMEGRDIGSVVLPDADVKLYVTASDEVRARRWQAYQASQGKQYSFEESLTRIVDRDKRDKERHISPLVVAHNAVVLDNSNLDEQKTIQEALRIIYHQGQGIALDG